MQIYLPIAEMAVPAEAILAVGTLVGFLSGVFGVGGGFLLTPLLIVLGVPPPVAVGEQFEQEGRRIGAFGEFRRLAVRIAAVGHGEEVGAFAARQTQRCRQPVERRRCRRLLSPMPPPGPITSRFAPMPCSIRVMCVRWKCTKAWSMWPPR